MVLPEIGGSIDYGHGFATPAVVRTDRKRRRLGYSKIAVRGDQVRLAGDETKAARMLRTIKETHLISHFDFNGFVRYNGNVEMW